MDSLGIPKKIYNKLIRPHIPYKIAVYNGIPVRGTVRLFDFTDVFSNYKQSNVNALRDSIDEGDKVIVIGGGIGVTTVVAAQEVGKNGQVITYEGSIEEVATINNTITINKFSNTCTVQHAIVGTAKDIAGRLGEPGHLSPTKLPDCDVLEMDCEGAEIDILSNLDSRPNKIVVETHPRFNSSTDEVKSVLHQLEYHVISEVQDPTDGHVLTAETQLDGQ